MFLKLGLRVEMMAINISVVGYMPVNIVSNYHMLVLYVFEKWK